MYKKACVVEGLGEKCNPDNSNSVSGIPDRCQRLFAGLNAAMRAVTTNSCSQDQHLDIQRRIKAKIEDGARCGSKEVKNSMSDLTHAVGERMQSTVKAVSVQGGALKQHVSRFTTRTQTLMG